MRGWLAVAVLLQGACSAPNPAFGASDGESGAGDGGTTGSTTLGTATRPGSTTARPATDDAADSDPDPDSTSGRNTSGASTGALSVGSDVDSGTPATSETGVGTEPCCVAQMLQGCATDPQLEACVCGLDAHCCDTLWDGACIQLATVECEADCPMHVDCCRVDPEAIGCSDPTVEACVCDTMDVCCVSGWGTDCVELATLCGGC